MRNRFVVLSLVLGIVLMVWDGSESRLGAHPLVDDTPRIAVISAYAPEQVILSSRMENKKTTEINGIEFTTGTLAGKKIVLFLSGISTVNAAMSTQVAINHWNISKIIFSGIAGGVDPSLEIGDVVVPDKWGQYLELYLARDLGNGEWETDPLFVYPYPNFGMMHPRSVDVRREGIDGIETRFWFHTDEELLKIAASAVEGIKLNNCTEENVCLSGQPNIIIGGPGVSGSAFVDNEEFRKYTFETFGARVLDMESAHVAHVAYANSTPFLAVRSLSDLAGGGSGSNEIGIFYALAAENAARVVQAIIGILP